MYILKVNSLPAPGGNYILLPVSTFCFYFPLTPPGTAYNWDHTIIALL